MNGRRSLDPTTSKPFNINIYYNINSKNITNNHEVQSHPVTARILKAGIDDMGGKKNQEKGKPLSKGRKKKYSVDLGVPGAKKSEKVSKKSNTNSICSGFPSQTNHRRQNDKNEDTKKAQQSGFLEKNEHRLGQLLQIFSQGKIDKTKLTREIINIFEMPQRQNQQSKNKKIKNKKRSLSTLIGTATPKNNSLRQPIPNPSIKNVLNLHKARRRQSKSQRGSFTNSKNILLKNEITQKIIECKNIDSSLFLNLEEEDRRPVVIVDRTHDVQTSYSIVLLNEDLKKERKLYGHGDKQRDECQMAALTIQRAWRKFRTRRIISNLLHPKPKLITSSNSVLQKVQCLSSKNSVEVQNFLSQQLNRVNVTKQAEIARVDQLRDHQLKKWNEIMDYVKISITNKDKKDLSSDQCLKQIIQYFENAKKTVQKELQWEKMGSNRKSVEGSRELTEFTCKAISKEIGIGDGDGNGNEEILSDQEGENREEIDIEEIQNFIEEQEQQEEEQEEVSQKQSQESSELDPKSLALERIVLNPRLTAYHPDDLSFEVVQNTLIMHSKKLQAQHESKIKNLDLNSPNYLQIKRKLEKEYKESKREVKRIIKNLNKGYAEAKNILEKEVLQTSEDNFLKNSRTNSKDTLQKCKSDNYLLKTAINYKRYIEKKQQKLDSQTSNQQIPLIKPLTKVKPQDNLQLKSIQSSELSLNSIGKQLQSLTKIELEQQENELAENKSMPFEQNAESGGGTINNNANGAKFNKLEQKIFSEEFLQYEQLQKQFDEDQQKDPNHMKSSQNAVPVGAEEISLFQNTKINQINKKLKYLTNEDKDDIFQFLFIDLTLQLITEYDQQTRVYDSIRKYVAKKKKLESIPKGVKTNLQSSKQYLGMVTRLVLSEYRDLYLGHIEVPMGPTAKEMLKYMHEEQETEDNQSNSQVNVPLILPAAIFQKLEGKIVPEYPRYYDDEAKQISRRKFLKSVDHIHHKALFDSLNEALDAERPFGIWGVPFPWKTTYKNNRKFQWQTNKKIDKLQLGLEKVVQCCSYMCGILPDKQESLFGNHKVSQNYVQQIREDRMSKMLANQLIEGEDRWAFYDDQQTQVLIELSRLMTLTLVQQFLTEFQHFVKQTIHN